MLREPAKELEPVPLEKNWEAEAYEVVSKAKEEEVPVVLMTKAFTPTSKLLEIEALLSKDKPFTLRVPEVVKEPAVTELAAVNDLAMLREPAKEEEPVPEITALPKAVMLPEEAMVKIAVLELFMNWRDSEAAGKLLVERRVNLC